VRIISFVVHALACLALVSCVGIKEETVRNLTDNTITQTNQAYALGGKLAHRWGVGSFWNGEKSFRDGALAAGAIATSGFSAAATEAQEVTKQVLDTNAATTSQKATAEAAAVEVVKSNNATKVLLAPPE
jgi:hypothetical protein